MEESTVIGATYKQGNKTIKVYSAQDMQVDEGKREVVSIINTSAIDRDGEVVQPKGMRKKNFQGNPVVFANHSYMFDPKALPIGYSKWVKASTDSAGNDVIIAKTYISDKTQEARDVFGLMQDGVMRAFSIGYESLRASKPTTQEINVRQDLKKCKSIVRDWDMIEYSAVGLPCNPEALALAVSKGYSTKMIDILSGKTANTEQVAVEIIDAVAKELPKKFIRTEKDIKSLLSKHIEQVVLAIDTDRIVQAAIERFVR